MTAAPVGIEEWWPQLDEALRDWLVNNFWGPLHDYALERIQLAGGPGAESEWWKRERDGSLYLPQEAVQWIIRHPDRQRMGREQEPDARAAYFRRTWPHRQ